MSDMTAFIGGGNMTRAIVGGLLQGGVAADTLRVSEKLAEARDAFSTRYPAVTVTADNVDAVKGAACVVLAVKPQDMRGVCEELRDAVQRTKPPVVSVAAGTRIADIDGWLGGGIPIVRVMPNQPALLGLGVSGLFANAAATAEHRRRAADIVGAVSLIIEVPGEDDIDTVTAISGTGPSYFYLLIDALIAAAITYGLDKDAARTLAIETAKGAAAIAAAETESMPALIRRVRSPGGTTAAAFEVLDDARVRDIFLRAIKAARDRSAELGAAK